jgi:hypothetical protein
MVEALHLGSVGLAAVGACCTAAARGRRNISGIAGALLMLAAMVDTALHIINIPAAAWALVLLLAAIGLGFLGRPVREGSGEASEVKSANGMALHRNVGLIVMAALLARVEAHHGSPSGGHSAHRGADSLSLILLGGSVIYVGASIWLAVRGDRTPASHRVESASMGLSVLTMAAGWVI